MGKTINKSAYQTTGSHDESDNVPKLLRLNSVLSLIPVGRSTWYQGVREGHYPKPIHLSRRTVAWDQNEILQLMRRLSSASS